MKTIRCKVSLIWSSLLILILGAAVPVRAAEFTPFVEEEKYSEQVVPVEAVQPVQADAGSSSEVPADTGKFLEQSFPLSEAGAVEAEPVAIPEVPKGWTRAASNENYAFQENLPPHAYDSHTRALFIMDLRTGESQVVGTYVDATGEMGFNFVDVSPDQALGKAVAIFEVVNPHAGTSEINFMSLDGTGDSHVLTYQEQNVPENYDGILDAIEYSQDGGTAYLRLGKIDGTMQSLCFDLGTLQIVPPPRWTRAASNENFAFLRDFRCSFSGCWHFLSMLDLRTGAETMLSSVSHYFLRGASYQYDVSPDGNTLIYSVATSSSWQGGPERNWGYTPVSETYIKDLNDPARSLRLNGDATKIQFMNESEAVVTIDGIDILINLQTLRVLDPRDLDPVHISTATNAYLTDLGCYQITPLAIGGSGMGETAYNFRQFSSKQFAFDYDLTRSPERWAAAMLLFNREKFDATANDIVLEANVTGASYYKLELEDQNGLKTVFRVGMTNGRIQVTNAMIQAVGVAGFDAAHLKAILLTVDDPNATSGTVTVNTNGLVYQPVISGSAYNPFALTALANQPSLSSANGSVRGWNNGTITVTQTSSRNFSMNYTLVDDDDFVYALLSNGYFDYSPRFVGSTMDLISGLTLAVNGPAGRQLKLEVRDIENRQAVFFLNLTGSNQNYTLDLQGAGIDVSRVAQIAFVADKQRMGSSGEVQVELRGINYIPVISTVTTDTLTDFSSYQFTSQAIGGSGMGETAYNFRQISPQQLAFDYDLNRSPNRWAAAMLLFNEATPFDASAKDIVFEVKLTGASSYKLELEDQQGLKTVFRVTVTDGRIRVTNSMIRSAAVAGFDAAHLKAILMTVESPEATRGSMTVTTGEPVSKPASRSAYEKPWSRRVLRFFSQKPNYRSLLRSLPWWHNLASLGV